MTGLSYAISILIPEGDPNGLRLVEKSNWNGRGIVTPRSLLADAKKRKEVNQTGVYVLYGPPEVSGLPRVYIGEGDPVASRLDQHMQKKDFWTHAAVFTSTAGNLNKAHVQYLEARLVQLASVWSAPGSMDTSSGWCSIKPEVTFGNREEAAEDVYS